MNFTYTEMLLVYASPCIPLGIGWWRLLRARIPDGLWSMLAPGTTTMSLLWLLLGSVVPSLWGAYYGHIRFAIIDGNFIVMILAAIIAFASGAKRQPWVGAASLMLALIWAFVAAINATV